MRSLLFASGFVVLMISCQENKGQERSVIQRDFSINAGNASSDLFFDSLSLEKFISNTKADDSLANLLRDFYNVRNYQYAWFEKDGMNDQAKNFSNLLNYYMNYSHDSALYNASVHALGDSVTETGVTPAISDSMRIQYELMFTKEFIEYIKRAYTGKNINPKDVKWYIPRRRYDVKAVLDSTLLHQGDLREFVPVNAQYNALRNYLGRLADIDRRGGWKPISKGAAKYKIGDSLQEVAQIKRRLHLTDDYLPSDTSWIFNDSLTLAIKNFQQRMGLSDDGRLGPATIEQMNVPANARIRQVLVNMERLRWAPEEPKTDYLLVNIPEFKLHVYENGKHSFQMNVVVGSTQHNTVIFTGDLAYVVFSPYWNVPPSIIRNEIVPGMNRDKRYLQKHNMEWNNGAVRQKPGPKNSLGLVKFLFPNTYNIYLHDTPSKSLFGESSRAFSHGCIRLSEPAKLAKWILRKNSSWPDDKISAAMKSGKEKFVTISPKIPVFIGYFSTWVDGMGRINFRKDVYGHDAELAGKLFSQK
jgi:L,D-transpeptidase YcbB